MKSRGAVWRPSFDRMIALLTYVPCVVLTTISTDPEIYYRKPPLAGQINAAIADAVAAHPNMHVVDWAAETQGPNRSAYFTDGIHESWSTDLSNTTTGAYRIAELDHQVITEGCGLADVSTTTTSTTEPEATTTTEPDPTTTEPEATTTTTDTSEPDPG